MSGLVKSLKLTILVRFVLLPFFFSPHSHALLCSGLHSTQCPPAPKPALCVFEYVYFARPDSIIEDRLVHHVRQSLGRQLAKEHPAPGADIVVGVPDSSTPIAIGYSQESGIPFTEGLTKNRYIQRTFIAVRRPLTVWRVANLTLVYINHL